MRACLKTCKEMSTPCPVEECRHWIASPKEYNCVFEAVDQQGSMSLREVADRIGVSFVRIKQIEDKALKKISLLLKEHSI